jgi:aspartate aminotransferase, mitochondrial
MLRRLARLSRCIYTQTHPHKPAIQPTMKPATPSPWVSVPLGPPDAILGITEAFKADKNPNKINLGVGAYRDAAGKAYVLEAVTQAEQKIPSVYPEKEYAGIAGLPEFCRLSAQLAFGHNNPIVEEKKVLGRE